MTEPDPRICKVCEDPKPLAEYKLRENKFGPYRLRTCDPCQREADRVRVRKYTDENREAVRERGRIDKYIRYRDDPDFRETVKDRSRVASARYYKENRAEILARRKARRAAKKTTDEQIEALRERSEVSDPPSLE